MVPVLGERLEQTRVQLRCLRGLLVVGTAALLLGASCLEKDTDGSLRGATKENHPWFPVGLGAPHELGRAAHDGTVACLSCHNAEAPSFADISCVTCHEHRATGTDPDGSQGMNDVHRGNPTYTYDSVACLKCHPSGNASDVSRADHTPFFPIERGTPHGALGCAECHASETRSAVTCTGCHRDENQDGLDDHGVAPMLAVHGSDMANLGYVWDTAGCRSCHASGQVPGQINHEGEFPIAAGTVHGNAGTQCVDCHANRQDRRAIECISCHTQVNLGAGPQEVHGQERMDATHGNGALPGYAWESRSCYVCHQQSQVPGDIQHDVYFPIGPGTAHELGKPVDDDPNDSFPAVTVDCVTCHQNPSDRSDVSCTDCHAHTQAVMQPTHGPFPDYQWNSRTCVTCHLGGQTRLNHPFFPVVVGSSHALDNTTTPAVDGLRCSDCHTSQLNRHTLSCTTCHRHDTTQSLQDHGAEMGRHGYIYDSGSCFSCHRTSQVPGTFDHEPIYPLLPPSGNGEHQALQCVDCHANRQDRPGSLQCIVCHQPTSGLDPREVHGQPRLEEVHVGIPGYAWSPRACVACHTDGTAESALTSLNHSWFPVGAATTHAVTINGGTLDCTACHATPGDLTPAALACVTCHEQKDDLLGAGPQDVHGEPRLLEIHTGVDGYQWSSPVCLECHPNGEASGSINHVRFPIATGSAHAGVTCTQCHQSGSPRNDINALKCQTCHTTTVNVSPNPTVAQIHNGIDGFMNTSPACFNCHPNSEPVGPVDHTAQFPITAGSKHASAAYLAKVGAAENTCTACHASRTAREQNRCVECHTSVSPTPATSHNRVRDYANVNADCKACHAESDVPNLGSHNDFPFNHHSASCRECHGNLDACLANAACVASTSVSGGRNTLVSPAVRADKPWAMDWNQYACLHCHEHRKSREDERHREARRNGFSYVSYNNPGCAACH